jgi:hypothetical protein
MTRLAARLSRDWLKAKNPKAPAVKRKRIGKNGQNLTHGRMSLTAVPSGIWRWLERLFFAQHVTIVIWYSQHHGDRNHHRGHGAVVGTFLHRLIAHHPDDGPSKF